MLGRAVEALNSAIDHFVEIAGGELHDVVLADALISARGAIDRLECASAQLAASAHREGVGAFDGAASTASWIRWRTGMRDGDARRLIAVGEALDSLPATEEAWAAGKISTAAARVIVRALADSDTPLADRRGLHASKSFEGMLVVSGELDPLNGEIVSCALAAATDRPTPEDLRTNAQRRADGLVRICRFFLDHADSSMQGGERPHVSVVIDWDALTKGRPGRCETETGTQLSPATVQRVLCAGRSRPATGDAAFPAATDHPAGATSITSSIGATAARPAPKTSAARAPSTTTCFTNPAGT